MLQRYIHTLFILFIISLLLIPFGYTQQLNLWSFPHDGLFWNSYQARLFSFSLLGTSLLLEFSWIHTLQWFFLFWDHWVPNVLKGKQKMWTWNIFWLTTLFPRQEWCLNESHLFGVFFGCWLGLCEAGDYFFSDRRIVKVPHVQLNIKVAVRSSISSLIKTSLSVSFKRYVVYIFLYLLFGGFVRSYILAVTRLAMDEPLDTFVTLINISLALRCILIGSACVFTIRLSDLFFQLYQIKVRHIYCINFIVTSFNIYIWFSANFVSSSSLGWWDDTFASRVSVFEYRSTSTMGL